MIEASDIYNSIQTNIREQQATFDLLKQAADNNDDKLSDCILLAQEHHNLNEDFLIELLSKLEEQFVDASTLLKIFQKGLDNLYYIKLGKELAAYIVKNKFQRKKGELLFEKLLVQFCFDFEEAQYFFQSYLSFENQLLEGGNEKEKIQVRNQISQIFQRVFKISMQGLDKFWLQYEQLETNKQNLEKAQKNYQSTIQKIQQLDNLEQQYKKVCNSQDEQEILNFFKQLEQVLDEKLIEFPKFINFYEKYFYLRQKSENFQFSDSLLIPLQEKYIEILRLQQNPHVLQKQLKNLIRFQAQPFQIYILYLRTLEQLNKDDEEFEQDFLFAQNYVQNEDLFKFSLEFIYRYTRQYLTLTEKLDERQTTIRELFNQLAEKKSYSDQQKAKIYNELAKVECYLFDNKLNSRAAFEKCVQLVWDNNSYWKDYYYSQISLPILNIQQRDRLRGILKRAVELCLEDKITASEDLLNFETLFGNVEEVQKAEEKLQGVLETIEDNDELIQQEEEEQQEQQQEERKGQKNNNRKQSKELNEEDKAPKVFTDSSKTIFIKYLPKELTANEVIALIPNCGALECRIVKDKNQVSKGFAYVDFTSDEDAQQAVNILNNKMVGGEKLYAAISKPPKLYQDDKLTLYLDNLPYSITEQQLAAKAGEGVKQIRIVKDSKGKPRGYAYIEYNEEEDKQNGLELLNQDPYIDGRKYFVKLSDSLEKIKQNHQNNSIIIKNLPFKVREIEIRQIFDGMNITQIEIPKNEQGKPKGFAFIEFEKQKHLKLALDLNGIEFKGRRLEIQKKEKKMMRKKEEQIEIEEVQDFKPKSNSDFKSLFKK
ncbi:unnamed protein product (macronuclear) [Paramecium tetraurelia]|uniref:RRM domain-containing protein n=1 Tax=Paramecium tetraurelia TaxID=5888 RepID=A0DYF5_PARTE|nr:uncharacterized protein GSPATT00003040001 [Paramecium tetraurelia]CAK88072.1 unnamed protein product [Paramecium tetraurelia]|eukprot:XP_001455469.1 hypothetical protein (macronuclear) [Paramecium tetraurelia strain d4-2]